MKWRFRIVSMLLALLCIVPLAHAQTGTVLWTGGHEAGTMGDWWAPEPAGREGNNCGGEYNNGSAASGVTTAQKHSGTYAAALRVPNMNTGSSEGARLFRWCESRQYHDLYYSAWYYIPTRVRVDSWWWLMQWKSNGSYNAKFGLAVANRPDGSMYIGLGRGSDSGGGWWPQSAANLPVGRWVHLETYYKKAADATGRVTVYQDGQQIIDLPNVQTANGDDLGWAVINYGQYTDPSDVTVYVDDAAISTARIGPNGGAATPAPTQPTPPALPTRTPTSTASYRVTGDGVRLRERPGTSAPVLAELRGGTVVEATDDEVVSADGQQWRRVKDGARTGWVATQFLDEASATATRTPAPTQPTPTASPTRTPTSTASYRVTGDGVRLRERPGASAPALAELRRGTVVEATDDEVVSADGQQWRRVKDGTRTGWVATQFLSEAPTPDSNRWCQKRLNHPQCVRR